MQAFPVIAGILINVFIQQVVRVGVTGIVINCCSELPAEIRLLYVIMVN